MATSQPSTSLLVMLGRIYWMMVGPMALAALALTIIRIGNGWFTSADIAFLALLAGLVLARWMEFRGAAPLTASGEPATPADLRRYALVAVLAGLGIWVVANLIGNVWLTR